MTYDPISICLFKLDPYCYYRLVQVVIFPLPFQITSIQSLTERL